MSDPYLLDTWAIDPNAYFIYDRKMADRLQNYLPSIYTDSAFLRDIYNAISPEIVKLYNMLEPYHSKEFSLIKDNNEGWSFEKLIGQAYFPTANHKLKTYLEILSLSQKDKDYRKNRSRLLAMMARHKENTFAKLKDIITKIIDIDSSQIEMTEDIANYYVLIVVNMSNTDDELVSLIDKRIRAIIPAHLTLELIFTNMILDEVPPIELDDPDAVLI